MLEQNANVVAAQKKLVADIKAVIADAEEMLHATAGQAGEKIAELRARIQDRMKSAQRNLDEAEASLVTMTRAAASAADAYVHENPWQAVGIGTGVGFLLGFILGRR